MKIISIYVYSLHTENFKNKIITLKTIVIVCNKITCVQFSPDFITSSLNNQHWLNWNESFKVETDLKFNVLFTVTTMQMKNYFLQSKNIWFKKNSIFINEQIYI